MNFLCLNLRKTSPLLSKAIRKETNDSSNHESMDEEDLALFVRKLNRFFKREKNHRGIQCHECEDYGHIRAKCANLQGNAFNATLSDDFENDETPGKDSNYLALLLLMIVHMSPMITIMRIVNQKMRKISLRRFTISCM
jgi:hypothetical protein